MTVRKEYVREWYSRHPLYPTWQHMRRASRTILGMTKAQEKWYNGVTLCDEWTKSYAAFEAWALENGWKKGMQVARIDKSGGYSPDNCSVTTWNENVNMRRCTRTCEGVPLRKVFGGVQKRWDRTYGRKSDRYSKCGWDVASSGSDGVVPSRENSFITGRLRKETKENME